MKIMLTPQILFTKEETEIIEKFRKLCYKLKDEIDACPDEVKNDIYDDIDTFCGNSWDALIAGIFAFFGINGMNIESVDNLI